MKFLTSFLATVLLLLHIVGAQEELPITTIDVFVQSGEVTPTTAVVMARCNIEEDSSVTVLYGPEGASQKEVSGTTDSSTDFTFKTKLTGLLSNTHYTYRVTCNPNVVTPSSNRRRLQQSSATASFTTLPTENEAVPMSFVWAADLAGQGWGRNPDLSITTVDGETLTGGYVIFDVMSSLQPDWAVFQGDMIYADGPIPAEKEIPAEVGGGVWTNNPTKDFYAISVDQFRANWKYNFGDPKMQSFLEKTPVYVQWDDHEVTNNWYPSEILGAPNYPDGTNVDILAKNSLQAFYEYNPLMSDVIYRSQRFGKHLEIFFSDFRSYRDTNPDNSMEGPIAMMGEIQKAWLINAVSESTATWKVLSMHDPIGIVTGGEGDRDSFGQSECSVLGREHELEELFQTIYEKDIKNVVSITSDVHFTAAISYDPSTVCGAEGDQDFSPFQEFVIGPIHAGAFGPNDLDGTFGPTYDYSRTPGDDGLPLNLPPPNYQSFGHAAVSEDGELSIKLVDITGKILYEQTLEPEMDDEVGGTDTDGTSAAPIARVTFLASVFLFVFALW